MKKIMMLFMVSVFFLMEGVSNSMAQRVANNPDIQVIAPAYKQAREGETLTITFTVIGNVLNGKFYLISLWIRRSGDLPNELIRIDSEGRLIFQDISANRITVSYNKLSKTGIITITNIQSEDEGEYFISVDYINRYWSDGTYLEVTRFHPFIKNLVD